MSVTSADAATSALDTGDEEVSDVAESLLARLIVYGMVGLSGIAALLHAWVAPEHFAALRAAGLFFVFVAFLQGAWAAALLDQPRSTPLLTLGLLGNAALILLWLAVHVVGLPLPLDGQHGLEEQLEITALAGFGLECTLVLGLALMLLKRLQSS